MVARSAPPPGAGLQYQLLFGFLLADLNTAGDMRISGVPFPIFSFTVYTYISCSPLRFSFRSDAVSLSLRGEPPLPSDLEDNAALASLRFASENELCEVCLGNPFSFYGNMEYVFPTQCWN